MNNKIAIILVCMLGICVSAYAQKEKMTREEKQEKNDARMARINNRNDFALFKKQILALPEYADERRKIPRLQKANNGVVVKVTAVVDTEGLEDARTIAGYIKQDVGDNSMNVYELTYDRATKKIASVRRTPEAIDADKEDREERAEKAERARPGAQAPVKTTRKKTGDEDDEEADTDEDKPARPKGKQKDEDD